jgi:hypothetical protein
MIEQEDLEALVAEAASLGNPAERRSLEAGLRQLDGWRKQNPGEVIELPSSLYTSPEENFRISFIPDFGYRVGGQTIAVHVWNTGSVDLEPRMAYAALQMAASGYVTDLVPDDVAVLSLPDNRLFRLSEAPDQTRISAIVAANIDALFEEIRDEVSRPGSSDDSLPRRQRE